MARQPQHTPSGVLTGFEACVLLSLAPLALVTACAKSPLAPSASSLTTAVTASAGPTTHISDPDEKTFVLLAELHSYDDPNENNVLGTLNIRLTQATGDPHLFNAAGLAHLVPQAEPYLGGALIDASGAAVITFIRSGDIAPGTIQVIFGVATTISSELAAHMIDDPQQFTAVFNTASGPAAVGTPHLIAPPEPDRQ
jgi:hypothetical protein